MKQSPNTDSGQFSNFLSLAYVCFTLKWNKWSNSVGNAVVVPKSKLRWVFYCRSRTSLCLILAHCSVHYVSHRSLAQTCEFCFCWV